MVGCGHLNEGPPTGIRLTAASDTTIRICWTAPAGSLPDSYVIAFKGTGTSAWEDLSSAIDSATHADHNPFGRTGSYRVTAVYDGRPYPSTDTLTSAPAHTAATAVGELNSTVYSGYGWDRDSGTGTVFTMTYASNADRVDFYITDWSTGLDGPRYYVASPDWGPCEPGGIDQVPVGSWRHNWFSYLPSEVERPLPAFDTARYAANLELLPDSTFVAVVCADTVVTTDTTDTIVTVSRHYALVKFGSQDTAAGTVEVETWFQPIERLRLIQH